VLKEFLGEDWIPEHVDVLRLEHGNANVFDLELCGALVDALARGAPSERPLLLTGTGSIFSAGVDLFRLVKGGRAYVERFLPALEEVFLQLFVLPRPVVAAINGHAIAGGCLLACACDYRIMAEGTGRIGVPELTVGVPFPPTAVELLRAVCDPAHLEELLYVGRTYEPREAMALGLVHEVVPADRLIERALEVARDFGSKPPSSFRITKQFVRAPGAERMRAAVAERQALLEAWASEETLEAVRGYLERTLRKKKQ
jgi:enoyl-CoA hydratase